MEAKIIITKSRIISNSISREERHRSWHNLSICILLWENEQIEHAKQPFHVLIECEQCSKWDSLTFIALWFSLKCRSSQAKLQLEPSNPRLKFFNAPVSCNSGTLNVEGRSAKMILIAWITQGLKNICGWMKLEKGSRNLNLLKRNDLILNSL